MKAGLWRWGRGKILSLKKSKKHESKRREAHEENDICVSSPNRHEKEPEATARMSGSLYRSGRNRLKKGDKRVGS